MIEFLLAVQVCNNLDGDCTWQKKARYPTEERCIANGLLALPAQFKCITLEHRAGPDQKTPIPRPRPAFTSEN
jgi:hypothetical protein